MAKLILNSFSSGLVDDTLNVRTDLAKRAASCRKLDNFIVQPHGGIRRRSGLRFITEVPSEANVKPFIYNSDTAYVVVFFAGKAWFIVDRGVLLNGTLPEEISTGLSAVANKSIDCAQSADVLFVVHETVPPFKINRIAPNDFEFEQIDFSANFPTPSNFSATGGGAPSGSFQIDYAVTAKTDSGRESLIAEDSESGGYPESSWPSTFSVELTWDAVPGADSYRVYKRNAGIYGFIAEVRGSLEFEDTNVRPNNTISPPEEYNPFLTDWPRVVSLFQQRLWLGSTPLKPQNIFASRIGQFEDFNRSFVTRADDSIENTIYSGKINRIRWIEAFNRDLATGTTERHWRIFAPDGGGIAPNNIDISPENSWGSAKVQPVQIGTSLIYVEDKGSKINDLFESPNKRSLIGDNLSVLAPSLFDGFEIVSLAFQRTPDPVLWCVRDDGIVLGMTYLKAQDIWAWHRHSTDGLFKSVTAIPGEIYDEVYFCVQRSSKFFIELMEDKWTDGNIANYRGLDSMLTYEGAPVDTVSGLDHLEGKEVHALADGKPITQGLTVSSGSVTLPFEASTIHVGLPYTASVSPSGFEYATEDGGTLGRIKSITEIILNLKESVGGKIGPTEEKLDLLKFTQEEYGVAIPPYTGNYRTYPPFSYADNGSFYAVQDKPLPFNLQALMVSIQTED
jgi:hypothetical protein